MEKEKTEGVKERKRKRSERERERKRERERERERERGREIKQSGKYRSITCRKKGSFEGGKYKNYFLFLKNAQ